MSRFGGTQGKDLGLGCVGAPYIYGAPVPIFTLNPLFLLCFSLMARWMLMMAPEEFTPEPLRPITQWSSST